MYGLMDEGLRCAAGEVVVDVPVGGGTTFAEGAPGLEGLYFATGFSGHGVMHSPATGRILADLILRGETDLIDWRLLDLGRFSEGRLIQETAVL